MFSRVKGTMLQLPTLLLSTLSLVSTVQSIAFPGPHPTVFAERYGQGVSPRPTGLANWNELVGDLELKRRLVGIDANTCGWVNGDASSGVECRSGRTCMLYTPSGVVGMAGCCTAGDYQSCAWRTRCIGSAEISKSCTDSGCLLNAFNLLCKEASAPYCVSWTYPADVVQDFGCGTDPASTWQTVQKEIADDGITTSLSLPYAPQASVTGWRSSSTSSLTNTRSSTTPGFSTSSPTSDDDDKKVPIGAIVGGVIGGLLFLVIVIGLIIGCCCWKRRKNRKAAAAVPPPPAAQIYQQQQQPLMSQQGPHQHQFGMPPPQTYYPAPEQQQAAPPYHQQQYAGAYAQNENKLSPNPNVYPVPSTSPLSSPISNPSTAGWGPPPSTSPAPDTRPVSEAYTAYRPSGMQAASPTPAASGQHGDGSNNNVYAYNMPDYPVPQPQQLSEAPAQPVQGQTQAQQQHQQHSNQNPNTVYELGS